MNLKEKLAALKKQAEEIMPAVERGDEDALKKGAQIAAEIEAAEIALSEADKFAATVKSIGSMNAGGSDGASKSAPRTLGEFVAMGVKSAGKPEKSSVNYGTFTGSKTAGDPMGKPTGVDDVLSDVQERVFEGPRRRLTIADLFGQETTSRGAVTYFVENSSVEGAPAGVAEGAEKPGVTFGDPTPVTEAVKKIAAVYKETDELLDDLPWLASSINNRGIYLHEVTKEDMLLNGTGTSNGIKGVLQRTGINTVTAAAGDKPADAIFSGMTKVYTASGFRADAIVINPEDYETLRLSKDNNGQYYGGGFFSGNYGNGAVEEEPPLWGRHTVVTPAIAKGTVLVGAFAQGGALISRKGLTVEIANQNEDDFNSNRISIRIEERAALAIRYPMAFTKVDISAATAAKSK